MKLLLLLLLAPIVASASISESKLAKYKGYTILGSFTVTGWVDENGKKGDSFEGCESGRRIIFDSSKQLICSSYSYSYSYRPNALILVKGSSFIMIIDGDEYEMRN